MLGEPARYQRKTRLWRWLTSTGLFFSLRQRLPVRRPGSFATVSGVTANVVFFRFGGDEHGADPIVAVFRDASAIEGFAAAHGRKLRCEDVYWQEVPVQGPEMPYSTWPELSTVQLVTEGGIGDVAGDTEIDPVAVAVFVDHTGAKHFAAATGNPNVVVRTVPLDTALPIPDWITGDALTY